MAEMSYSSTSTASASPQVPRPRFAYLQLEPGHFRLLRIISTSDNCITCEMRQFPIQEPRDYFALSYVWGDANQDQTIIVNDSVLNISQHLLAAIETTSSLLDKSSLQQTWIWIDAICIDQENRGGKAIQVPLMGDIYGRAKHVLIWFGVPPGHRLNTLYVLEWLHWFNKIKDRSDDEITEDLVQRCEYLERLLAEVGIGSANLEALYETSIMIANIPEEAVQGHEQIVSFKNSEFGKHLLPIDHEIWLHLLMFLNHEWYWRVWTIQEIKLARDASLLSEQCDLPWDFLDWFRKVLRHRKCINALYSFQTACQVRYDDIFRAAFDARTFSMVSMPAMNHSFHKFQILLLGIRRYRAKVRKDYIYGLLGIVEDDVRSQITVDYTDSTSTAAVFAQAVMAACRLKNGASFWCMLMEIYMGMSKEVDGLPSWAPDFSSRSFHGDFSEFRVGPMISPAVREKYKPLARISFQEWSSVVTVRGIRIDRVVSVITIPPNIDQRDLLRIVEDIQSGVDLDERYFLMLFGSEQQSWLHEIDSLFPGEESDPQIIPPWLREFYFADAFRDLSLIYRDLRAFIDRISTYNVKSLAEARDTLDMDEKELGSLFSAMSSLLYNAGGRYTFRTAGGRMGFAPSRTSPGDSVCFIPGDGSDLHVLSPDQEAYITAGACVEGFTQDDLMDTLPSNESEWEDFHLH